MYKIINKKKLIATMITDVIGNIIFFPKHVFKKNEGIKLEGIREILVIRTAYIGDVVMTVPILKPLKERFPDSRLSFLTSAKAKDVLENNPYVDDVITYDPFWFYPSKKSGYIEFIRGFKKRSFDLVIEARGDIRELLFLVWPLKSKFKLSYDVGGGGYLLTHIVPYKGLKHKIEYHLDIVKHLGCETENFDWGVHLTENEKDKVKDIIRKNGIKYPFISVHPGGRLPLKRWAPERYAALCDNLIKEYDISLVLLSAWAEMGIVDAIIKNMKYKPLTLVGKLNLRELSGILAESSLFICNDSAPLHIASAMKTPTVAIFGPSKSRETGPYGNIHRVVEKDFPCRYSCDENGCKHRVYNECMAAITTDDVFNAIKDIMKTRITIRKNLLSSEDRVQLS